MILPEHNIRTVNPITPATPRVVATGAGLRMQSNHNHNTFAADDIGWVDAEFGNTPPGKYQEICVVHVNVLEDNTMVLYNAWVELQVPTDDSTAQRDCVLTVSIGNYLDENPRQFNTFFTAMRGFGVTASGAKGIVLNKGWWRFEFKVTGDWGWYMKLHGQVYASPDLVEYLPNPVLSYPTWYATASDRYLPQTPWLGGDTFMDQNVFSGTVVRTYRVWMNWSLNYSPGGGAFYHMSLDDWNAVLGIYPPGRFTHGNLQTGPEPPFDTTKWVVMTHSGGGWENTGFYYPDFAGAGFVDFMPGYIRLTAEITGGPSTIEVSHDNVEWTTVGSGTLPTLVHVVGGTLYGVPRNHLRFLVNGDWYQTAEPIGSPGQDVIACKMSIAGQTIFDVGKWD